MKNWYVYKIIFDDGYFYIGYRGTKKKISDDFLIKYFTSSKVVKKKIKNNEKYIGLILFESFNKTEAYNTEQQIINDNFSNPKILNRVSFYNRKGFGLFSQQVLLEMSLRSKNNWKNDEFRRKQLSKKKWSDERKKEHSQYLKDRWENDKKYRNAVILSHTENIVSDETKKKMRKPKPIGFGLKISKALKGKKKTLEHIIKLKEVFKNRKQPLRVINPVFDHKGNIFQNVYKFAEYYNVNEQFFKTLDKPIRYGYVFDKLGIDFNEENKRKTKLELGFNFC